MPKQKSAIEMLTRCHGRLNEQLDELCTATEKLASGDDADARQTVDDAMAFLARVFSNHFADEEESVFPRLPNEGAARTLADELAAEHVEHRHNLDAVRGHLGSWSAAHASAEQLRAALHAHAAREDEELTTAMREHLSPEQLEEIAQEMRARRRD